MLGPPSSCVQVNGQLQAAVDWLRKKGVMAATKKAGRVAAEGLVGLAVADDKLSAAVVEVWAVQRTQRMGGGA